MSSELISKGHIFIAKSKKSLDVETRQLIDNNEIRFTEGDFYFRKDVTGGSNTQVLFDETNEKSVDVTNIDKNMLPNKEHLALQYIGLRFCEAVTGAVASIKAWTTLKDTVPAALLNGEIVVAQEGKTLVRLPIARFFTEVKSDKLNGVSDVVELKALQLIKARTPISVTIEYAKGQTVTAAAGSSAYLEVRLMGEKTVAR